MSEQGAGENSAVAEVLAAERARCRAISDNDWAALEALLDPALTYTHVSGHTDNKVDYLNAMAQRSRRITRSLLEVRLEGDVAVMTGLIEMHQGEPAGAPDRVALQVWVRRGDSWKLLAVQVTKLDR